MVKYIKIFNPKEKPYGALSNNSTYYFELNGNKWKTVTHYVYANLLHFTLFKTLIRNQNKVRDIYPLFLNLYSQELHDITISAVNEANEVKFSKKELKDLLLATENYEIIYISNDPILGVKIEGDQFIGENIIGKSLMRIRRQIKFNENKNTTQREDIEDKIYEIYKAYYVLETYMNQDNTDVAKFINSSYNEIINSKSGIKFPDKKIIIQLYNRGSFPIISEEVINPGNLVSLFRKENIEKINKKIKLIRKNTIFSLYINYWIKKKNEDIPENDFDKFRKETVSHLNSSQIINLRERVAYLFEKGMLSESLSVYIDKVLKNLPSPISKEEIINVKNFRPILMEKEISENKNPENKVIFIYEENNPPELQPFSPDYHTNMEIFAHEFPTVSHYILIKLMSILKQFDSLGKAYSQMIIEGPNGVQYRNLHSLREIYNYEKDQEYISSLMVYSSLGMDKKFAKSYSLQNLLLSTEDAEILYSSRDSILGTGSREEKGKNYIGKYLGDIRNRLVAERLTMGENLVKVGDIGEIILGDLQLREWMGSRLVEICQTIGTIQEYFQSKYEFEFGMEITANFVLLILSNFYTDCFKLYGMYNDENKVEAPKEFIAMLSTCKGFNLFEKKGYKVLEINSDKKELIQTVWNYFVSMIYSLIKISPRPTQVQLKKLLSISEINLTKEQPCIKRLENKKLNCILSALFNILFHLKEFTLNYGITNFKIEDSDIIVSMKILLNSSPVLPMKLPDSNFNEVELSITTDALKKIDSSTNEVTGKYILDLCKFISEYKGMSKSTKQNRINFFMEENSKNPIFER